MSLDGKWTAADIPNLQQQVVVITGANSGIGLATAQALAHHGATVILACRHPARGQAAAARIRAGGPSGEAIFLPLDLADLASVDHFVQQFRQQLGQLDLLINNAGIMHAPAGQTADGYERHFGTNYLGHFALTGRLLPLLLQPRSNNHQRPVPPKRIVNVSSLTHLIGRIDFTDLQRQQRYRRTSAYAQSKLALLAFTFELQRRLQAAQAGLIAVAAHPGWAGTNLHTRMPFVRRINPLLSQSAEMGALPTLYAATAPEVAGGDHYGPGGWLELRGAPGKAYTARQALDPAVAGRLWQRSEALSGVHFPL